MADASEAEPLPEIHTLWVGEGLGPLERLCLTSWVRQGHRVVLHAYRDFSCPPGVSLRDAGDLPGFAAAWGNYTRAIAVHAAMEDGVEGAGGGSARMLDHHFDGAAGAAMFAAEHVDEHRLQQAVTDALLQGMATVRSAFATYRSAAEAHLKHEEDIMMPLVARLPQPKAPLFAQWCVSAGIAHGDFDHFVS